MEMTFSLDIQPFHFDFSGTKPNNYNFKLKLSSSFSPLLKQPIPYLHKNWQGSQSIYCYPTIAVGLTYKS